jgi:IclR family pca regulon transcriptional regulator
VKQTRAAEHEVTYAGREFVQGLQRGFSVLKAFSADATHLTIADVAGLVGLTRAVARRYLFTLRELGYVAQDGQHFTLTPRVLDLGFAYLSTMSVATVAQPYMEQVVKSLRESCSISVLDARDVVYIGRVTAKRMLSTNLAVGSRLPAHCTSMGKVLLAALSPEDLADFFAGGPLKPMTSKTICDKAVLRETLASVRERGWAFNDGESEEGVRSVAVPVVDRIGSAHVAMNLACLTSRVSLKELRGRYLAVLTEAADGVSRALGAAAHQLPPRGVARRSPLPVDAAARRSTR